MLNLMLSSRPKNIFLFVLRMCIYYFSYIVSLFLINTFCAELYLVVFMSHVMVPKLSAQVVSAKLVWNTCRLERLQPQTAPFSHVCWNCYVTHHPTSLPVPDWPRATLYLHILWQRVSSGFLFFHIHRALPHYYKLLDYIRLG